jgi:hypothetical protein
VAAHIIRLVAEVAVETFQHQMCQPMAVQAVTQAVRQLPQVAAALLE